MRHPPSLRRAQRVADPVSDLITVKLPRGEMDLRLRLARYADGSPALELQDPDGAGFYSPTIPVSPVAVAAIVPPEAADEPVVAIKPSAFRNGIANALIDAGLLIDLDIEIPADRTWARLMTLKPGLFGAIQMVDPESLAPLSLRQLPVPAQWQPVARRIRLAFQRQGLAIAEADAMLAFAFHSKAFARTPPVPPLTGEEIVAMLKPYFAGR